MTHNPMLIEVAVGGVISVLWSALCLAPTNPIMTANYTQSSAEHPAITMLREVDRYIGLYTLLGIIAIFFLILFLFGIAQFINEFTKEMRYLNCEIGRTEGEKREYYIRKRRRLWLSLIPFVKY